MKRMWLAVGVLCAVCADCAAATCRTKPVSGLDFVNPLIGTKEIPGLDANYGGMQPMVGVPFGSMHLVPMTRTNAVARVSFASDDRELLGFALTRQPAIWMGEWGKVEIRLAKPLPIESVDVKQHYAKICAGGRIYELVASSHVVSIRTDDETLGDSLAETGWTSERTIRTGADPKPNFRCDWNKRKQGNILKVAVSLLGADQARANFGELPDDFDAAVRQAKGEWEKYFSRIAIDAPDEVKTIFYTGLYHALLYPRDMTEGGRHYSGIDDKVHDGVGYDCYSLWDTYRAEHPLLTLVAPERADNLVNVCEIKFSAEAYVITKRYAAELATKIGTFRDVEKIRKGIHLTFITASGLLRNSHSGIVQSEVTLDDLFRA